MRKYPSGERLGAPLALVAALTLAACYPAASISGVQDLDTVSTAYNLDGGFTTFTTFNIPGYDGGSAYIPEIMPDGGTSNDLNHAYDLQIMQLVQSNFEKDGYMYVGDPTAQTTFTVFVRANSSTYTQYYNYWGYYCAYYPYYYCGGGWIYYPYPIYSTYDVGTLVMDMEYPASANTFNWLWSGVIRGILSQGTISQSSRLTIDINQAFAQSPYLDKVTNP
jgi:hypothetical protein